MIIFNKANFLEIIYSFDAEKIKNKKYFYQKYTKFKKKEYICTDLKQYKLKMLSIGKIAQVIGLWWI
jgi:hypothetical protein